MTIPILTRIVAGGPAAGVDFDLVASIEARAPVDADKALGREQIFLDTSATPHALHYHSGVAADGWELIGGGATVTSGTADPTGGEAGDQYLQVNASNVAGSIWLNVAGTWTEFTLSGVDQTARDAAAAAQTTADAAQTAAEVDADIAAHAADDDAHHAKYTDAEADARVQAAKGTTAPGNTPGSPSAGTADEWAPQDHDHGVAASGSGVDQTARDAAAAAQTTADAAQTAAEVDADIAAHAADDDAHHAKYTDAEADARVQAAKGTATPVNTGTATPGTSDSWAPDDHDHGVESGGGGGGSQNYYPIDNANVGGTANAITLTTGQSLTALTGGMLFFFNSTNTNTGATTINVDGIGTRNLQRSRPRGEGVNINTGSEALEGGEITNSDPVMVVYGSQFNEFYLLPSRAGTAAYRNIGTAQYDVPSLGAGGDLPEGVIPAAIARLDGPTFTGAVTVPTPTADGHAATKGYVDSQSSGGGGDSAWKGAWSATATYSDGDIFTHHDVQWLVHGGQTDALIPEPVQYQERRDDIQIIGTHWAALKTSINSDDVSTITSYFSVGQVWIFADERAFVCVETGNYLHSDIPSSSGWKEIGAGGAVSDAPLDTDDPQSESTTAAASRQAITEAIASLGGELGAIGPFHFRINQDATQTDSQAAHTLGGIYQNTSGRPLRVREAFVPVHPGGSGATEYTFFVWKVDRVSATSYMTDVASGASESLRTTADGTTIGHDVARGIQSTLHGFTRAEVIIAPGEYFMVAVYRSVNGTAANTIVASGADVSQDYEGALEYVAKASFSGAYGTDPVEVYHNSTFAERMQLIFTFEDEGLLPPIHGIHRKEIPEGRDRIPFSDEGEVTNPNAYVEWDDLLALIRNVTVYTRSRPQATADNLYDVAISAINRAGDICLDVPHRTTAATGTWTAITPGTDLEYVRVRSSVTAPVQSRYYYEYFTDEFWFGTDVGSGVIRLIQDDADDALAAFLTAGRDTVVWLHHHATDAEALLALQTLEAGHEAFYWNTTDQEIRKLTDYVPPGVPETGHHYQWVRLFGGPGGDPDGGGAVDSAPVILFDGPDTPATYVPNVAARPNFRPLVLSRAPMANRSLQIEIESNTPNNTTANPTPTGAVTIYTSDHIETNHLVGDDALPALAGAQLTAFSTSGNQGPSVGNSLGSKIGRGNENDTNDFGHSNIWVGHGLNADGDFVLYVAHSHWSSLAAHKIRVQERAFGGGAASEAETGGGQRRVARSVISSGTHLAITPRTFNPATGTPGFAFSAVSIDDVPIADLDSFSATIRIGDRAGFTMYLSKEQIEYAGRQNDTVWEFTDANNYTGGSVIPCLFLEGKHNTDNYMRTSIKPTRSQVGYIAGSNDGLSGVLIFFVYDPSNENINHVWTVAFSDVDVEVEEMHFHFLEDA